MCGGHVRRYQSYAQAKVDDFPELKDNYIALFPEQWPKSWKGRYKCPVVRLLRNLYGQPLAGLYWEMHCHDAITKCGFQRVHGWECLYKHSVQKLFLSVYVDDFKMAGRPEALKVGWQMTRKKITLDSASPHPCGKFLGCEHEVSEDFIIEGNNPLYANVVKPLAT